MMESGVTVADNQVRMESRARSGYVATHTACVESAAGLWA
jgi:hypothetical protein